MQQMRYITNFEVDTIKQHIEQLFKKKQKIVISLKNNRIHSESHDVSIEGVYQKFFTVRDEKLKANFTIQFFDIITGNVLISTIA